MFTRDICYITQIIFFLCYIRSSKKEEFYEILGGGGGGVHKKFYKSQGNTSTSHLLEIMCKWHITLEI